MGGLLSCRKCVGQIPFYQALMSPDEVVLHDMKEDKHQRVIYAIRTRRVDILMRQ